jgi:putative prepilin-type N-cleavage/methylation domain protein
MRKGFSLIELILSIVVVGITAVAIPTVVSQTSTNNTRGLIQQSVMDAKTRMALVSKAPYSCVGNFPFSIDDKTPIFGSKIGTVTNNFYTKNGIDIEDTKNRRQFGLQDSKGVMKTVDFDQSCNGLDKSIKSFDTPNGEDGIKTVTSTTYGERDNIIESVITTHTDHYDMKNNNVGKDGGITRIQITSTTSMGQDTTTVTLRAYAANIGDSPDMLSKTW